MKNYSLILGGLLAYALVFSGCGGGGGSSKSPTSTIKTGVFLDSAVEGVKYKTSSGLEGYTNANGEYQFNVGDTVEFLVGDISLGQITAADLISVLELSNSEEVAMLLQALDDDGNPENGINITPEAFALFEDSSIDVRTVNPDDATFLSKFKQVSGDDFRVDRESALEHANYSLMLENLKAVSANLYAYYVGEANIYGNTDSMGKTVNAELFIKKSSRRLKLYNYNYVITPELDIMSANAKSNIDSNFDSHDNIEQFIANASIAVAETIAVIDTKPEDFTSHLKERSKEFALDQLLVVGKEIIDTKYLNVPIAVREVLYREMVLVYGCTDMFAKPSTADVASCVNTLTTETLNIFNDAGTAWQLYNSTKALNTLTLVREYLNEYFNAGGDYAFIYNRYGVNNETDYVASLKTKTLVPSNVFWTQGDYLIDDELFQEQTANFIGSVVAQSNAMVQNYGLKVDYDALNHSFLIPHITKGKYNIQTNDFSICYTVDNSSYFDISNLSINIKIDDETSTLVEKNTELNDMYKAVRLDEQCINIPLDSDFTGLDDKYFLATATLSFLAEGKSLTSTTTQAIYLSESNIFDLLKKLTPPTIVLNMATQAKDGDIFLVSASDSYVDPSQGELSFQWQQIENDGYNVTLQDADKAIPNIALPLLPTRTEQKTIWFEVKATASISKQETIKTFSLLIDASAEANVEVPQANAGMDVTIFEGESFTFEGTNTNAAYSDNFKTDDNIDWYWLNKNGDILSDKQSFTKTFSKSGAFTFELEISDNNVYNQDLTTSDTITITVVKANTPPVANAGGNQNETTNVSLVLDGSQSLDADGDAITYQWVITDAPISNKFLTNGTTSKATFRTDKAGLYTISLTVNDGKVFSVASIITVSVSDVVVTPKVTSLSPLTATQNIATTFTITGENLPDTIAMSLQDSVEDSCSIISKNSTNIEMRCIPALTGTKSVYVATQTGGDAITSDVDLTVNIQTNTLVTTPVNFVNSCYNSPINPFDQWEDSWYECTRYAFGRSCETTGEELTYTTTSDRHGGKWYDIVNAEYQRGSQARANSLAVWSYGDYGHVAYVESVDGDNITISEANWASPTDGKYNGQKTLTNAQMLSRGSSSQYQLVGYVYLTKYPTVTLSSVTSQQQGEEFSFQANLSQSLDVQYSVKISLGDGGGGYLSPILMTPNVTNDSFTFSTPINDAGNRVYRVSIFDGDTQVSSWVEGTYTVQAVQSETMAHNGFTYSTVASPHTGRIWLDRNIGASQVCTESDDSTCYGDYYQWGRDSDGHEKIDSETSSIQSDSLENIENRFILSSSTYYHDWVHQFDSDGSLRVLKWSKTDEGNICPIGFRVPLREEILAESISNVVEGFDSFFKFPASGHRSGFYGSLNGVGNTYLWSNSVDSNYTWSVGYDERGAFSRNDGGHNRSNGYSIRCIKAEAIQNTTPQNLTVTQKETNVLISWDSVENTTSYNVYFSQDGSNYQSATDNANGHDDTQTSFTFPYTNFSGYFKVKADDGDFSEIVQFTWVNQAPSSSLIIKKTGQTKSYDVEGNEVTDGSLKDDGYYQSGATPSYTNSSDMVTDEITGLMWQDDIEVTTVTKPWLTQTNYDICFNDETSSACYDTSGDTATTYCSGLILGGYTDWRLPTSKELLSIVDYSKSNLAIDRTYFKNVSAAAYRWSSTTILSYMYGAWIVEFAYGNLNHKTKDNNYQIRCVREMQ